MSIQEFIANKKMLDVEWRFSSLQQQIVQKKTIVIAFYKNMIEETTHFELTLAQFNELFTEIEKVKNLMSLIK